MGNKLSHVLRNVLTLGLIIIVCFTGPFAVEIAFVGLVTCILYKCIHWVIRSVLKENLPNWYIAPTFRNRLRICCFAVSLILYFVSAIAFGRMSGEHTVMGSLGAVHGTVSGITSRIIGDSIAYIKEMIGFRIGFTKAAVRYAIWGL